MNSSTKGIVSFFSFVIAASLTGCNAGSSQIKDMEDQVKRLESQIQKERQDNAELSSFRFTLESQYRQKAEAYNKCQEDSKETLESLRLKYNTLVDDFSKMQVSYKSVNETYTQTKKSNSALINSLEEKIRLAEASPVVTAKSKTKTTTSKKKKK
ncbi:MAG: hypothetical protein KA313_04410 [Pseudarcicella sp.]|nr:hypothetical protein [Pseudarcicella sp.]MBP6410321.1 hypothetical protein [Pseudarcicella sp.]